MSDGWNGLYLKSKREEVSAALLRLATARGYQIRTHLQDVTQATLDKVLEDRTNYFDGGKTLEIVLLLTLDSQWTRVIGLELREGCYPRMFYSSDFVMLLNCDAFECGFLDSFSWWYVYYENGQVVDRFDSDPIETFAHGIGNLFGFEDPRHIYCKCAGYHNHYNIYSLPAQVIAEYQGHPERLAPIIRNGDITKLREIFQEKRPIKAIRRLSQVMILPYIGEFEFADFTDSVLSARYRSEPTPPWVKEAIEQGLTMTILAHPKSLFGIEHDDILIEGSWL